MEFFTIGVFNSSEREYFKKLRDNFFDTFYHFQKKYLRHVEIISDFILHSGVEIYRGSPGEIFNGKLGWTGNGGGYIENNGNLPNNSVGFWISDKNLVFNDGYYHYL